jgi:hypothetical protein
VVQQVVARYVAGGAIERVAEELGLTMGVVRRLVEERTRVSAADDSCGSGIKRSKTEAALAHAARSVPERGGPPSGRREWPAEAGTGNSAAAEVLSRYAAGESGEVIAP